MTKYTTLCGVDFETIKSKKTQQMIDVHCERWPRYSSLADCYDRPSDAKRAIYDEWMQWSYDMFPDVSQFGITSYNTFDFTLGGLLFDSDDNLLGYIRITKAHNYLYLL